MKYIITEQQYKRVNEITIFDGVMRVSPTYKDVLDIVIGDIGEKTYYKSVKQYVKKVLGYQKKFKKRDVKDYGRAAQYDNTDEISEELKKPEVLSNMAYLMAKKFLKVKMLGDLECYVKSFSSDKQYFFFDPELEMCVGSVYLNKRFEDNYLDAISLPEESYSVSLSKIDNDIKGMGYGKLMYLAVLSDVDVLMSDKSLYTDSLNIWVNVLPRYALTGAVMNDGKLKIIKPSTPVLKHEDVSRYFATKKLNLIELKNG